MAIINKINLPLATALAAALASPNALAVYGEDFEFHGYMRSGIGWNNEGGDQVCFQLPGARAKYRLGNECETYIETVFNANLFQAEDDGAYFKLNFTFAFVPDGEQDFEQYSPAVREAWIESGNVAGGFLEGAKFWAGKRFYRRHDVHINDFYYWDVSGPGAGIEDVNLGFGKIAYAVFNNVNDLGGEDILDVIDPATGQVIGTIELPGGDIDQNDLSIVRHDLRVYDIDVNPGGKLTVGLDYRTASEDDDDVDFDPSDGWGINLIHLQDGVAGGINKLVVQYAKGSAAPFIGLAGTDLTADEDDSTFRVVEMLLIEPNEQWSLLGELTYETQEDVRDWWSFGVRPKYYVTDYFNIAAELGYDRVEPDEGEDRSLWKFTIAPQLSAGRGFWTRPLLRAFVTYADWNDAAQEAGLAGGTDGPFGSDTAGWSWGFQAEAWW